MEQKTKRTIEMIMVLIILAGMIMLLVKGLNFDLKYQATQRIEMNLGKTFDLKEMKQIAKEVFAQQTVLVQTVEVYQEGVCFTTKEITQEQKTELIKKINEKYQTEIKEENINLQEIAHTRGRDMIKPYWLPFGIVTILTLIYLAIRYHKLNTLTIITRTIGTVILMQILLLSVLSLTRIPIGRMTIPMVLSVYMLSLVWCINVFEKELKQKKEEIEE